MTGISMATPALEGFGIRLEPISLRHIPLLLPVAREASIWRYMPLRLASADDVQNWVTEAVAQNETETSQIWITRLTSGEVVGSSRLFDLNSRHRTGEIGFTWLTAPYRGTGVNPRVKLLQLTHAFETLGLRRVALKTHHENLQSQRGILTLGAQFEGTFRNHMIMPDGSTRHTLWYSIVAEEWPAVKAGLEQRVAASTTQPAAEPERDRQAGAAEPIE